MLMLDEETVKGVDGMIDAVVRDGNIQLRMSGAVVPILQQRMMFTDRETVERSFAYAIYHHGMQLDQIENFLKVAVPNSPFKGFLSTTYAVYASLNESRDMVLDNIDDIEWLKTMAEGDYIFTLVLLGILNDMKSKDVDDILEYSRIYSLPKSYENLLHDFDIVRKL